MINDLMPLCQEHGSFSHELPCEEDVRWVTTITMLALIPIFFLIAVLYSTVGLGGGTAYITAMVLAGIPKEIFPMIALGCNLLVAGQGFLHFRKAGHFRWDLFWPFAVTSIPAAYLGGTIKISDKLFTGILALALIVGAFRLLIWKKEFGHTEKILGPGRITLSLLVGLLLGILAGITGIGGGIYLIPTLLFLGWAKAKEASAVASLFIFVNSASGMVGQLSKGVFDWKIFLPLACAVIIGGFIGGKAGATKLRGDMLQKIVGVIMLIAVWKLLGKLL